MVVYLTTSQLLLHSVSNNKHCITETFTGSGQSVVVYHQSRVSVRPGTRAVNRSASVTIFNRTQPQI